MATQENGRIVSEINLDVGYENGKRVYRIGMLVVDDNGDGTVNAFGDKKYLSFEQYSDVEHVKQGLIDLANKLA